MSELHNDRLESQPKDLEEKNAGDKFRACVLHDTIEPRAGFGTVTVDELKGGPRAELKGHQDPLRFTDFKGVVTTEIFGNSSYISSDGNHAVNTGSSTYIDKFDPATQKHSYSLDWGYVAGTIDYTGTKFGDQIKSSFDELNWKVPACKPEKR